MQKISIIHKASGKKLELTKEAWVNMGLNAGWIKDACDKCGCGCDDEDGDGNCTCEGDCTCAKCKAKKED